MAIDNQPTGTRESVADRRVRALELRKQGYSYRAIGEQLGVSSKTAWKDVQASLAELARQELDSAAEYRALEEARLDALEVEAWRILLAAHPLVSGGKVLSGFTADGQPIGLTDAGPKLAAIDKLRGLSESRRKLRGLDAPTKIAPTNSDGTPLEAHYTEFRTIVLSVLPMEQRLLLAEALESLNDEQPADNRSDDGA